MEYFIGSVVTILMIILLNILTKRFVHPTSSKVAQSQSYIYNLIGPYTLDNSELLRPPVTQSSKHMEKMFVKVVIVDGHAYWIQDEVFYMADVVDDEVDKDTRREVDTMAMDKVQLNKIMLVVEKLREGTYDDNWNSGKSKF